MISDYSQILFCRFSGIFIEKTTFEEFVEICEEIQYNDENKISNIDLLTNFFLENVPKN